LVRVVELQELDRRLAELTREISYLPKHIATIESRLESHRRKLEADRASLAANLKERKRLEDDVKVWEEKVRHLKDQMSLAKTNEQYWAFQHEIEFGQKEIRKIEDRILDRMAEAENLEKNVKAATEALEKESAEVEGEKKEAEARTAADRAELAEDQKKRSAAAGGISPKTLAAYEHISRHRGGIAVSEVREGRCTACNVLLRPHLYQKMLAQEEVLTCEACGRILYELPPADTAKESEACKLQSADSRP
jgi:predicted  nucleic acid-binding Zn-ribbon protein